MAMLHRHGGTIVRLTAIEHYTHKPNRRKGETGNSFVAWEFRGHVKWQDGTESPDAHIDVRHLMHDGTPEMRAECLQALRLLDDYLEMNGSWSWETWTPHKPKGRRDL